MSIVYCDLGGQCYELNPIISPSLRVGSYENERAMSKEVSSFYNT